MPDAVREQPVIKAVGVKRYYKQRGGSLLSFGRKPRMIQAVDGVDFEL